MHRCISFSLLVSAGVLAGCTPGQSGSDARLVLAATTSIEDSGLLDTLVAAFTREHPEIEVSAVAVGTGQALVLGRRGDADILLSHDSLAEMQLVADGIARGRRSVMYNSFIIAGPPDDPAHARGTDAVAALESIARSSAPFISRGDDSGTHRRERVLWQLAGIDPLGAPWYIEAGLGMGDALLLAGQKRAYVLTDRATFLSFRQRAGLVVVCDRDAHLRNPYGVTVLNGPRAAAAEVFADWVTGEEAQGLIATFGVAEQGEALFAPSAHDAARHDTIPIGER